MDVELEHVIGFTGTHLHTLVAHSTDSKTSVYPIGSVIVIANNDDPHDQHFLRGHDETVTVMSISPCGRFLASGQAPSPQLRGKGCPIIVWDLTTRETLFRLDGHTVSILSISWSPDARYVSSSGEDGRLAVWDMETGTCCGGVKGKSGPSFIAWTSTLEGNPRRPSYTFCAGYSNQVFVYNWSFDVRSMHYSLQGRPFGVPGAGYGPGFHRTYHSGVIDPSNNYCLAGTATGEMVVYRIDTAVYRVALPVCSNGILCICPTRSCVFVGGGDGSLKKLRGEDHNWEILEEAQLEGKVTSLSLTSGGAELLVGTSDGRIYRALTSDLSFVNVSQSQVAPICSVSFGKRSDVFGSITVDGSVRVWDLSTYFNVMRVDTGIPGTCCMFAKDDNSLVCGFEDGFIRCYDGESGAFLWQIVNAHKGAISTVAVVEQFIVSGGADRCIRVWSRKSHELVVQFVDHMKIVTSVLQDCRLSHVIHTCSRDKTVLSFDLKRERRIAIHPHPNASYTAMTQRIDNEYEILAATSDGRVVVWDVDLPDPLSVVSVSESSTCECISLSPSGKYVAAAGSDCVLRIFDVSTWDLLATGSVHSKPITSLAWSVDEKQIVTSGEDCAVCVWNCYSS